MYMCVKGINFVFVSMISRLDLGSDDVVFLFFIDNYNNPTSTLQQYFSYIKAVSFIGRGNLSQITDKFYHIMLHPAHLAWAGSQLTLLVVICTGYIGSCKSNYHRITTTTAPYYQ
jgi:hypothetical protein